MSIDYDLTFASHLHRAFEFIAAVPQGLERGIPPLGLPDSNRRSDQVEDLQTWRTKIDTEFNADRRFDEMRISSGETIFHLVVFSDR